MSAELMSASHADEQADRQEVALWNLHGHLARLAGDLADMARGLGRKSREVEPAPQGSPTDPQAYFESLLALRRNRNRYFGSALFGEPAWDVMLELMVARIASRDLRLSQLSVFKGADAAEARDYVNALIAARIVDSYDNAENPHDPTLVLAGEAARRMAELYRARMRG